MLANQCDLGNPELLIPSTDGIGIGKDHKRDRGIADFRKALVRIAYFCFDRDPDHLTSRDRYGTLEK
jgi:hypothetical protein